MCRCKGISEHQVLVDLLGLLAGSFRYASLVRSDDACATNAIFTAATLIFGSLL